MDKKVVIASNNKGKISEIKAILGEKFSHIYSLEEANISIDVLEDGDTFKDNAIKKAKAVCEATGLAAIADDSGLCVDALNGAPGVHSARFAGEPCDDEANNVKLLRLLDDVVLRTAKFVSAVAIYFPDGSFEVAHGEADGEILKEYKGNGGFGYDKLFYSLELNKSFGEATNDEKNKVSHRAKAIANLLEII